MGTNGLNLNLNDPNVRNTDATKGPDPADRPKDTGDTLRNPDERQVNMNVRPGEPQVASREGATSRPTPENLLDKPKETTEEVETRLDPTQPASSDSNVTTESPEKTFLDPPTPAENRKDALTGNTERQTPADPPSEIDAPTPPTADDGVVRYSSHPIMKYKVGRFRFENGLLELKEQKDIDEFEKILKSLPRSESNRVKKLDLSAAEAQIRAVRAQSPKASKAIGSDTGDRAPRKEVGLGRLEDSNN